MFETHLPPDGVRKFFFYIQNKIIVAVDAVKFKDDGHEIKKDDF
jgi:hypothetical protein